MKRVTKRVKACRAGRADELALPEASAGHAGALHRSPAGLAHELPEPADPPVLEYLPVSEVLGPRVPPHAPGLGPDPIPVGGDVLEQHRAGGPAPARTAPRWPGRA